MSCVNWRTQKDFKNTADKTSEMNRKVYVMNFTKAATPNRVDVLLRP